MHLVEVDKLHVGLKRGSAGRSYGASSPLGSWDVRGEFL
jgi:hypothetical protein